MNPQFKRHGLQKIIVHMVRATVGDVLAHYCLFKKNTQIHNLSHSHSAKDARYLQEGIGRSVVQRRQCMHFWRSTHQATHEAAVGGTFSVVNPCLSMST